MNEKPNCRYLPKGKGFALLTRKDGLWWVHVYGGKDGSTIVFEKSFKHKSQARAWREANAEAYVR